MKCPNSGNVMVIVCNVDPGKAQNNSEYWSDIWGINSMSLILHSLSEYYHIMDGLITFGYDEESKLDP